MRSASQVSAIALQHPLERFCSPPLPKVALKKDCLCDGVHKRRQCSTAGEICMPESDVFICPQPPAAHGLQVLDETGDLVVLSQERAAVLVQLQVACRQRVQQIDQGLLCMVVHQGLRAVHGNHDGMEEKGQVTAEVLIMLVCHLSQQAHGQLWPSQNTPVAQQADDAGPDNGFASTAAV